MNERCGLARIKTTDVFQVGWLLGNDEHKMNLETEEIKHFSKQKITGKFKAEYGSFVLTEVEASRWHGIVR